MELTHPSHAHQIYAGFADTYKYFFEAGTAARPEYAQCRNSFKVVAECPLTGAPCQPYEMTVSVAFIATLQCLCKGLNPLPPLATLPRPRLPIHHLLQ